MIRVLFSLSGTILLGLCGSLPKGRASPSGLASSSRPIERDRHREEASSLCSTPGATAARIVAEIPEGEVAITNFSQVGEEDGA